MNMPQHDKKTTSFAQFLLEVRTLPIIPRVFWNMVFFNETEVPSKTPVSPRAHLVAILRMSGFESTLESNTWKKSHTSGPLLLSCTQIGLVGLHPFIREMVALTPSSPVYVQLSLGVKIQGKKLEKKLLPILWGGSPPQKQNQPKHRIFE